MQVDYLIVVFSQLCLADRTTGRTFLGLRVSLNLVVYINKLNFILVITIDRAACLFSLLCCSVYEITQQKVLVLFVSHTCLYTCYIVLNTHFDYMQSFINLSTGSCIDYGIVLLHNVTSNTPQRFSLGLVLIQWWPIHAWKCLMLPEQLFHNLSSMNPGIITLKYACAAGKKKFFHEKS